MSFRATIATLDGTVIVTVDATSKEAIEKTLIPLSNDERFRNDYRIYANGNTMVFQPELKGMRLHTNGLLSNLVKHLPKHPGGRPTKKTPCPTCMEMCDSYTQAKAHCFLKRLGKA